jgi:uncharacterized membrane protein YccC
LVLGNEQPFFASMAAIVSLGVTFGQRGPRMVQLVLGVAIGLTIANVLVLAIGVGTVQIGIVVALAAALAIFLGGKPLLVTQTAISAMLVVALDITKMTADFSPDLSPDPDRFFEALIGSSVALVVNALLPVDPELRVERAVHPIRGELVATLEEIAAALTSRDLDRAERTLLRARKIEERMGHFKEALAAGYETARFAPPRRKTLRHLELYAAAASQIDMAVADMEGVARSRARRATQQPHLGEAIGGHPRPGSGGGGPSLVPREAGDHRRRASARPQIGRGGHRTTRRAQRPGDERARWGDAGDGDRPPEGYGHGPGRGYGGARGERK